MAKGRNDKTYYKKLATLKSWHTKRLEYREKWTKEKKAKHKNLKPLEWYVEQLKKSKS